MTEKFYITTPIYYPNDVPHIGHAYTTIAADVLARWNKLQGKEVFFLTGTDDHGKKILETAKSAGKTPKEFTDELIPKFKDAWKKLNINYDRFIRTTDPDHEKVVQEVLQKCFDNGDIYKGEYEGLYCTGCEAYYTEKELEDGKLGGPTSIRLFPRSLRLVRRTLQLLFSNKRIRQRTLLANRSPHNRKRHQLVPHSILASLPNVSRSRATKTSIRTRMVDIQFRKDIKIERKSYRSR
jgi:hypothetical protein